ncbi:MAG: winged helix-turn-helix domain-containing protein [Spirochaetes bacterium]|nr:winged helix-turn-helix domain-containing protein [Spirochaetota bacterium]
MALEDFLGETSEIKILDFLAENMDTHYNQTEISEFTGLSRTTVNRKIPEMIHNNTLEIKEKIGKMKAYQLADNEIVKMLISASLAHSFKQSENPLNEEESQEKIREKIGFPSMDELNRFYVEGFYVEPVCDFFITPIAGENPIMRPVKRTISSSLASA